MICYHYEGVSQVRPLSQAAKWLSKGKEVKVLFQTFSSDCSRFALVLTSLVVAFEYKSTWAATQGEFDPKASKFVASKVAFPRNFVCCGSVCSSLTSMPFLIVGKFP